MSVDLVFIVMLIGHVLGDFYLQTEKIVKKRKESIRAVFLHGLIYTLCMLIVLLVCIPITKYTVWLFVCVSATHLLIDILKFFCIKSKKSFLQSEKQILIVDQGAHFATLTIVWWYLGQKVCVRGFISQEIMNLPNLPIIILLGVLCILRPISILITHFKIWNYTNDANKEKNLNNNIVNEVKNAGRIIGYLERTIVFILLLYNQFGAMAFILTAKSVARFKEIEQDKSKAEYYLIGTLLSVTSVLIITIALGLCGSST